MSVEIDWIVKKKSQGVKSWVSIWCHDGNFQKFAELICSDPTVTLSFNIQNCRLPIKVTFSEQNIYRDWPIHRPWKKETAWKYGRSRISWLENPGYTDKGNVYTVLHPISMKPGRLLEILCWKCFTHWTKPEIKNHAYCLNPVFLPLRLTSP